MSGETRRTVGDGLSAHVGDRLSRRWAVGMSGRKGSLLRRLGVEDPWSPSSNADTASDPRARREARMSERLGRFDRMTGMRAAFRRTGGSAAAPRFGFDLGSMVFPRMLEDAVVAEAQPAAQAAAGRSPTPWVGARRSESPWLSPRGGPARVIRGQRSVHSPSPRPVRAPVEAPSLLSPALRSPRLSVAAVGAPAAQPDRAGRLRPPSAVAAREIAALVRPSTARAAARRAAARPEVAPELLLRAALGPAARLVDAQLSDGLVDRALPPARLAAARLGDPRHTGPAPRGLRPVLSRSPSIEAVVIAHAAHSAPVREDERIEATATGMGAAPPPLRRLSASPVRSSARRPQPRTPVHRAAQAALGVVARAAQRDADPADPSATAHAAQVAAPGLAHSAVERATVERTASSEPRSSLLERAGLAAASGPVRSARAMAADEPTGADERPPARLRATAVALDRVVDPTPPADERAARIDLREGRFVRAARHAEIGQAPTTRTLRGAGGAISTATFAAAPVAPTPADGDVSGVAGPSTAPPRSATGAGPRRVTGSAAWASRRVDVGATSAGSVLARPTAHHRAAQRPRAVAALRSGLDLGAEPSAAPAGRSSAPRLFSAESSAAAVSSRSPALTTGAAQAARSAAQGARSAVQDVARGPASIEGAPARLSSARAVRAELRGRIARLVEIESPLSAVEHVLERATVGARAIGSTLPQPMPRSQRAAGVRRATTAAPGVLPAPLATAVSAAAAGQGDAQGAAPDAHALRPSAAAAPSRSGLRAAPRTVAQLRAAVPSASAAPASVADSALPGPRRAASARPQAEPSDGVSAAIEAQAPRAARAVERAARRLEVLDAPTLASLVPAPAAAARLDASAGARPLARASRAAAPATATPRGAAPASPMSAAILPQATSTAVDAEVGAAQPGADRTAAVAASRGQGAVAEAQGARRAPASNDARSAAEERELVRAVAHAAARVGLTISPDADLHVAVERLTAANARVERAERSVLPRPTARPERAIRAQLARSAPGVVYAQPGAVVTEGEAPAAGAAASGVAGARASAPARVVSGWGPSPRSTPPATATATPAARPSAASSPAVNAVARAQRAPGASRAARQGLASLSPTARAAVVDLLRRRARPSALGYSRLASQGAVLGQSTPERLIVAGDSRVPAEAAGVEVQVRRAKAAARPLDFAEVRAGHELSSPELSARGAVRTTTVFRTPFGDVEVPAVASRALSGAPGVRQGRHLTRSAEGRYLPTAAALASGLIFPASADAGSADAALIGSAGSAGSAGPASAAVNAPAIRGESRPVASRAAVGSVAPRGSARAADLGVVSRKPALAPEGVVARSEASGAAPGAAPSAEAGAVPTTGGRSSTPVRGFAARPDLRSVLGAVDQGHAERSLPVWARRASGEPLARGTGGDFVQSLASARSEEDVVRVIVEQGGALNQVSSTLPRPVIQVIEHIRSEARAELEDRLSQARGSAAAEGTLPDATRTRREPRHAATRENVQVVKALTGLKAGGGARKAQGVGDDRVMKLARKLQQLIHLAEGAGDRDAARRQVRMAEDSAQARSEGQGPGGTAEGGSTKQVDIEALGREVLEMVSRELEMRRERRQEDPDGRNVWW
jgi:hypothetical protein